MAHYVLVSAAHTDIARNHSTKLRDAAERAGCSISELSDAVWLATVGPVPVRRLVVGPWLLIGDVFNRRSPTDVGTDQDDPEDDARKLVATLWGRYIGVRLAGSGELGALLRDPSGALECVVWEQDGLTVATSSPQPWLFGHATRRWRPNLGKLALAMRDPLFTADWLLLDGPTTVPPGVLQPLPLGRPALPIWRPATFARRSLDPGWTVTRASAALVEAVDEAVAGLANLKGPLASEISGGLDSSIVAGSLVTSAPNSVALWLNAYGDTPEADERPYVLALAKTLGIAPTFAAHAQGGITEPMLERISGGFRPGLNALDMHHDLEWARRLQSVGAASIMTGKGGDSILLQNASVDVFADLWMAEGWRALFAKDTPLLAARNEVSVWTMVRAARQHARRGWVRLLRDEALLPPDDVDPPGPHPWLLVDDRLGPAKIRQIAGVIDSVSRHGPSLLTETIDVRHPLCAQPVIETCLAIPTPLLTLGGRDRGLARSAFRERLPLEIAQRRSKGDMTRIYGRKVIDSLGTLRPWLLDGKLAQAGIIDRSRTEVALSHEDLLWRGQFGAIIRAAAFEGWLRVWDRRLSRP